jgi:hypothetical protein
MAKAIVTFDLDREVNAWKFGQYLAEILEIPQGDPSIYNITGIDDVVIKAESVASSVAYSCLNCEFDTNDADEMDHHIDEEHPEGYGD